MPSSSSGWSLASSSFWIANTNSSIISVSSPDSASSPRPSPASRSWPRCSMRRRQQLRARDRRGRLRLDVDLHRVLLGEHLEAGLELALVEHAEAVEDLLRLLSEQLGQRVRRRAQVEQAALLGLDVPLLGVVVAVEDDLLRCSTSSPSGSPASASLPRLSTSLASRSIDSATIVLSTVFGRLGDWLEPSARNSNLLPVNANGLVRLRSPASRGSSGSDRRSPRSIVDAPLVDESPCSRRRRRRSGAASPRKIEMIAGGASLAPRR